jgi:Flp pilus assembly protein TadB
MSFVGSTRRMVTWGSRDRSTGASVTVWAAVALGLILVWAFLGLWYFIIFGAFGIFVFPYRLIRRSQRKSAHLQRVQLATMQAMMAGQMKQADSPPKDEGEAPPLRAIP